MTTGFGALSVDITADATNFTAVLKNAEGQLASTQAKMNRVLAAMEKGFKSVAGGLKNVLGPVFSLRTAFASLVGAGGLGLLTKNALDSADALVDMADRIGISTDALQEMIYVASLSGLSIEAMETGLRKLNATIADQAAGKKTVLGQLGIEAKDAAGNVRPLTDVLLDLADAFQKAGPQSAAGIRVLTQAFGERAGTAFAGALKDGAAGVRELIGDAQRLGLVLDRDLLRGAASANDALDRMKMIVGTNLTRVLLQLAPSIERVAQAFADAAPKIQGFADFVSRSLFGLESLSLRGLAAELKSVNDELERENRLDAAASVPGLGITLRGDAMRNHLEQRKAEIEARIELENERLRAAASMPSGGGGAVPTGMRERPDTEKMGEYLAGLRESVVLAQAEADEREVLEAVLRAENVAREDFNKGLRASKELTDAERESVRGYVQLRQEAKKADDDSKRAKEDAKRLYEETRTPAEQYAATLERINLLLAENAINEDTANRARAEAKKTFEQADEGAQQAKQASDQLAMSFKSAFEEAVTGGKSLQDIFVALIEDIVKMILQLYILKPLLNSIANQMEGILGGGSGGGIGGFLGSIFGGGGGAIGGAGGGATGTLPGFANGGSFAVGGHGGTDSQLVSFRATPGEMVDVRTPGQAARGGGGDVIVQVINNSKEKTSEREGTGPNGEKLLQIVIGEVEKRMRTPGSGLHSATRDTFGLKPALSTR